MDLTKGPDLFRSRERSRDKSSGGASGSATGSGAGNFVPNDREKARSNIVGLHAMAAALTNGPHWLLTDEEANSFTAALCDVMDFHKIDMFGAVGALGLYASLAGVGFAIYMPRLSKSASAKKDRTITMPATPEEARTRERQQRQNGGAMDFSADIETTFEGGTVNGGPTRGTMRFE